MKKTLTYLVILLTLFVSVSSSHAAFTSSSSGFRLSGRTTCHPTREIACTSESGTLQGTSSCSFTNPYREVDITVCTIPVPQNSTCTGSGTTRTCSCNTNYYEYSSGTTTTCQTSCGSGHKFTDENGVNKCVSQCAAGQSPFIVNGESVCTPNDQVQCTAPQILNVASSSVSECIDPDTRGWESIVTAAIGAAVASLAAAVACSIGALVQCLAAGTLAFGNAGLLIAALSTDNAYSTSAASNSPGGSALEVSLSPSSSVASGVNRDANGNLSVSGSGWSQNQDTFTKTSTDGTKTHTTTVNTKTDTMVHETINTANGTTTKTVTTGGGGSGGSGGGSTVTTSVTSGSTTTVTQVNFNQDGQPTSVNQVTCNGSNCTPSTPTDSDNGNGDGDGDGENNGNCPECDILTNILNTLKGQGTDGEGALDGIEQGLDQGLANANQQLDQAFESFMDGLPIEEALNGLGLNPLQYFDDTPSCSLPISMFGVNAEISYCEWQDQIHAGVAFFAFIMFLFSVRDVVFERPQ